MNINFLFHFEDEDSYDVILNIKELSKQSPTLQQLCNDILTSIENKTPYLSVPTEQIHEIWEHWESEGVKINPPCRIDRSFELYEEI